jgi:hypothetical protein
LFEEARESEGFGVRGSGIMCWLMIEADTGVFGGIKEVSFEQFEGELGKATEFIEERFSDINAGFLLEVFEFLIEFIESHGFVLY